MTAPDDMTGDGHPERARRLLYGRRQSKKLRATEQRRMETLLPAIRVPLEPGGRIDPATLFGRPMDDLWLEIGFGGGEHLAARALAHPGIGFIGCEPYVNGAARMLRQVEIGEIANIRAWDGDARDILDALPPGSIGRAFLLYPDPWPKRRHWKRRFVQQSTLTQLHRVLRPGEDLLVATDIPDYARWTLQEVWRHGGFAWTARQQADWRTAPQDWPGTKYENKALEAGRPPIYLSFKRV